MRRALGTIAFLMLVASGACHGFATNDIGQGLGSSCAADEQCQGSTCVDGLCTIICGTEKCPSPMKCVPENAADAGSKHYCQLPVSVGFIDPGDPNQEPFSLAFAIGRSNMVSSLGYVVPTVIENRLTDPDVTSAAETLLAANNQVIVIASPHAKSTLDALVQEKDGVKYLVLGSTTANDNVTSFDVRTYQAYYLAGIEAAHATQTLRLGMIASTYTPAVVASVNAFTLGARSIHSNIVVEVRWVGGPHDLNNPVNGKSLERVFTESLMTDKCDVIAHTVDNNIPVSTVAQEGMPGTYSISANTQDGCGSPAQPSCIGSVYYQWAPVLTSLIDAFHRQKLPQRVLASIQVSPADTPIEFVTSQNCAVCSPALSQEIATAQSGIASDQGVGRIFKGPITSSGMQCETANNVPMCVAADKTLDDQGLANMCWFVDGVITHDDAGNTDAPAIVPDDCALALKM